MCFDFGVICLVIKSEQSPSPPPSPSRSPSQTLHPHPSVQSSASLWTLQVSPELRPLDIRRAGANHHRHKASLNPKSTSSNHPGSHRDTGPPLATSATVARSTAPPNPHHNGIPPLPRLRQPLVLRRQQDQKRPKASRRPARANLPLGPQQQPQETIQRLAHKVPRILVLAPAKGPPRPRLRPRLPRVLQTPRRLRVERRAPPAVHARLARRPRRRRPVRPPHCQHARPDPGYLAAAPAEQDLVLAERAHERTSPPPSPTQSHPANPPSPRSSSST